MSRKEISDTHTEAVPVPRKKNALALNLDNEVAHIRNHGSAYLPIFLDNMRSFTMETDTQGRRFEFRHVVKRYSDGSVRLFLDDRLGTQGAGNLIDARTSYLKPALESDRPDWDRQRCYREYEAIVAMERMLEMTQPGDTETFIESSNAPFDQPEAALKGTFFGKFSFIRTHTLQTDLQGTEILKGYGLKHFLDWDAQTQLHTQLTGNTEVTKENLLGTVDRLRPIPGVGQVEDIADIDRYIETLPKDRFVPHEEEESNRPDEAAIHDFIDATEPVLHHIFRNLSRDVRSERSQTLELITYWREAVRDFCKGIDRRIEIIEAYNQRQLSSMMPLMVFRDMYQGHSFQERYSLCGDGMGYGELGGYELSGLASYEGSSYGLSLQDKSKALGPDRRIVTCPTCSKDLTFSRSAVIKAKRLECPCGACATGCDAEVIAMKSRVPKPVPGFDDQDLPMAA